MIELFVELAGAEKLYRFYKKHCSLGGTNCVDYAVFNTLERSWREQIVRFVSTFCESPDISWCLAAYSGSAAAIIYEKPCTGDFELFIELPFHSPPRVVSIDTRAQLRLLLLSPKKVITNWNDVKEYFNKRMVGRNML